MRVWLATLLFLLETTTLAAAAALYDAAADTTPDQQGWAFLTNPLIGAQASQRMEGGRLILNSSQEVVEQAGYFSKVPPLLFERPDTPRINLSLGPFSIAFSMRQVMGIDVPDTDPLALGQRNRGGFAVIVISEDLTGVELQFQVDHVVALDNAHAAFPVGEVQSLDTTQGLRDYQLDISTSGYELSVDGISLLEGPLRDYSAIAPPSPFDFPYTTPSFFFFGDNTGRGGAVTELGRFEVSAVGDCTDDGVLDQDDLACVDSIERRDIVLRALNTLPGDLDFDGAVAFADFLIMSANFGRDFRSYPDGNIDLQDGVSFADFLVLSANFGRTPDDLAAVPEASCSMLCLPALLVLLGLRRSQRPRRPDGVACVPC